MLAPVRGCLVQNVLDQDLGDVSDCRFTASGELEVEVHWSKARRSGWHRTQDLSCGLREQMWVELVGSPGSGAGEVGQIVQFREMGGQTQALVDFISCGRRCWLPYQLLSRRMDLQERLVRGKVEGEGAAERFRLRCLAHGLEIWNENTGALSGLEIEPLPHQVSLVHHILASGHYNWLIADDVGLGKTIEVGLLLHAHLQRDPEARILIVCPAGLTTQWQEELRFKFGLKDFDIYGQDFKIQYADQWFRRRRVIASIDRLKQPNHLAVLQEVHSWDLVVFDEAHRLTRHERGHRYSSSERFELAAQLRKVTPSLLLLTATPHQGREDLFRSILGLLRPDLKSAINLLDSNREILLDMVIRNPKSEVRNWEGERIFRGKEVRAIKVGAPPGLLEFTGQLEDYFRAGYNAAEQLGAQGRAIGFVMTVYRKLAASSIYSITEALRRRLQRLLEGGSAWTEPDEEQDLRYRGEQEEKIAQSATAFFPEEESRLRNLIRAGEALIPSDTKIQQLFQAVIPAIREKARFEKVVIFTEYRSTQQYLQAHLVKRFGASSVVLINGSMTTEERRESIRRFEEVAEFLISTEAGGEGINLQRRCHTMINYDIPWNPTRLVQRIGRLYRYGQEHPVLVFNLHSNDTLDARIVNELYSRIDRIVHDLGVLGGDFNSTYGDEVFGQIAELTEVEGLFEHAYRKQQGVLDVEITEALSHARKIYEERKDIFSYFTQTLTVEGGGDLLLSQRHLEEFVHGMASELDISIAEQSRDEKTLTLKLPEAAQLALKYPRSTVTVTFNRDEIRRPKVEVMDWNSPFLQALLKLAKGREFGGQLAAIADLPGQSLVVSLLYWQSSQGKRTRRELSLTLIDRQGQALVNPRHLLEYLLEQLEDGALPDKEHRKMAFQDIISALNTRLAEATTPHLHPEGIEFLALALRGDS